MGIGVGMGALKRDSRRGLLWQSFVLSLICGGVYFPPRVNWKAYAITHMHPTWQLSYHSRLKKVGWVLTIGESIVKTYCRVPPHANIISIGC